MVGVAVVVGVVVGVVVAVAVVVRIAVGVAVGVVVAVAVVVRIAVQVTVVVGLINLASYEESKIHQALRLQSPAICPMAELLPPKPEPDQMHLLMSGLVDK
jgi:hypothetical protein